MYRFALEQLKEWKGSDQRKPLIIEGARQVGKTWLMKEFGATHYKRTLYVNFDQDEGNPHGARLRSIFERDLYPERIIEALSLEYAQDISAQDTLLIFDEIQEIPRALTSLKYFNESAPHYHILAAGSQMGIALHQGTSFPVGKVSFLKLQPLNFDEFLIATNRQRFCELFEKQDWQMISTFAHSFIDALKEYFFVGGMPEVVQDFAAKRDFARARVIQLDLIESYRRDFGKHAPALLNARLQDLFSSIPRQLAKENKKFVWGAIRPGARSRDYELAVQWLVDCSLAYKVPHLELPYLPLETYCDQSTFKLYLHDVGLLGALCNTDPRLILDGNEVFREFKGTMTEQYVLQQLVYLRTRNLYMAGPSYWTGVKSEVDFVVQINNEVIPIEVKSAWNLRAKSLRVYLDKYHPAHAIRTSLTEFRTGEDITEIPLYAILHLAITLPFRT